MSVVLIGVATVNSFVINGHECRKGVMRALSAIAKFKFKYLFPKNVNVV